MIDIIRLLMSRVAVQSEVGAQGENAGIRELPLNLEPRRIEQRTHKTLKGMPGTLLKDSYSLERAAAADLYALITEPTLEPAARAGIYKEQLQEILESKQVNVMRDMLAH